MFTRAASRAAQGVQRSLGRARTLRTFGLLITALVAATGCRAGIDAYAGDPDSARLAATQVVSSVQFRFDEPSRDDRYEHARMRMARYALAPSKVENDTIWTRRFGSRREVTAHGRLVDGRYVFSAREMVPMPARIGESRHHIALDTLADGDRLWYTQVDQAIGSVAPAAMREVLVALLRSAERSESEIRADYRGTMPRAATSFGRLAVLDSVRTVRMTDGSTMVTLGLQLHPAQIEQEFPDFARYLKKYVSPARYRFSLHDASAVGVHARDTWFRLTGANDRVEFVFRSRDGKLQPFDGPSRPMPDTLSIHVHAAAKFGVFTVGVTDMRGRFVFVRSAGEVGWDVRFDTPPQWDLPPVAGRLVRGSLNRPFQGEGVTARLTVKRLGNGQTVIHRRTQLAVRESAIMRWLGNLGFTAMDDFAGRVELQEARFLSQGMRAMRQDIASLAAQTR